MESFELFCESLNYKEFESILEYDTKDVKRIDDFFKKSGGNMDKVIKLATQMSKTITNPTKAFNRGEAAIDVMKTGDQPNPVADIFFARANELGYDPDKIPVTVPKSPKTADMEEEIEAAKEDDDETLAKTAPTPKITREPSTKPASLLPVAEQYSSTANPKTVPGPHGAGTPIAYIGSLNLANGKCGNFNLFDLEQGTAEVWKLNDDEHIIVFNEKTTPAVAIETPCGFLDALNKRNYLFYAELVDYIDSQDMHALIDLYGEKIKAYKYEF
jgi:hypothetical protein